MMGYGCAVPGRIPPKPKKHPLLLRLDPELHARLKRVAKEEDVSVTHLIVYLLERGLREMEEST